MKIIAASGYARAGKDTFAEALMEKGWVRIAFADKLRDFSYELNPIVTDDDGDHSKFLKDIIDDWGWNGYKEGGYGASIREFLQVTGQAARNVFDIDFWVNLALSDLDPTYNYVISDARYPNEMKAIKNFGGESVRIARPGVTAANAHISEIALDDYPFDHFILNDLDVAHFKFDVVKKFA